MNFSSFKKNFTKKIEGFLVSPLELLCLVALVTLSIKTLSGNLSKASQIDYDMQAMSLYETIKSEAYSESSSPKPFKKYLMKNIIGPGTLTNPLTEVILGKGLRLNYLIRINQSSRVGQSRYQLRFEVSHDLGQKIFRYTEIGGEILEQVIQKTVLDE